MIQKFVTCIFLFFVLAQKISAKVYHISSEQKFKVIESILVPGDKIAIKNGNYAKTIAL